MANKVKTSNISNDNEMFKLIKLVIVVSLIVLVFYLITMFVNKEKKEETTKTPESIQYDYILASDILKKEHDKYYILIEKKDDLLVSTYTNYLYNYKSMTDSIATYYVELDSPFNSKYKSEEADINNLKFSETTLLYIEKGKIKKSYIGKEDIIKILEEITKTEN